MEVDVAKYLSDEEMGDIVREEFRKGVAEEFRFGGIKDVVAHAAKVVVLDEVKEMMPDFGDVMASRVVEIIGKLDRYDLFHDDGEFYPKSHGRVMLDGIVTQNADVLATKVHEIIDGLDHTYLRDLVVDVVYSEIAKWMAEGANNG